METTALIAERLYDGCRITQPGCLRFDDNGTVRPGPAPCAGQESPLVSLAGRMVMPGLIDLHSDALEKCIEMRAGVFFDDAFAIQNLDRRLAACGITTFFHAISFADNELGLRSPEKARDLVHRIHEYGKSPSCLVRHRVHVRFEIGSCRSLAIIETLLDAGLVDLLSFMDHTPGQGQFRSIESYLDFYRNNYRFSEDAVTAMIAHKQAHQGTAWQQATSLAQRARNASVPILSHDDDTAQKVELVHRLQAAGCEFPITLEAADEAAARGLKIFMGAPNLVRGASTNGNLKASEAIERGVCSGLISDYYPECMLQAAFMAEERMGITLSQALGLVTCGPGAFIDPDGLCGTLREGARADFIVVNRASPWARVEQTWVGGRCVFRCQEKQGNASTLRNMASAARKAGCHATA